jgi:hypothetical protein
MMNAVDPGPVGSLKRARRNILLSAGYLEPPSLGSRDVIRIDSIDLDRVPAQGKPAPRRVGQYIRGTVVGEIRPPNEFSV